MGWAGIPGTPGLMCRMGLNREMVNVWLCPGSSSGRRGVSLTGLVDMLCLGVHRLCPCCSGLLSGFQLPAKKMYLELTKLCHGDN